MSGSLMGWILVGLVSGLAGGLIGPGREAGGMVTTILVGIAGALLGGYLGRAVGAVGPSDLLDWAAAALGSVILIVVYRLTGALRR